MNADGHDGDILGIKSWAALPLILFGCWPFAAMSDEGACSAPKIIQVNDHVTAFYFGRGLTGPSGFEDVEGNWVNAGAWDLGVANYVVHQGDNALVFDTSTLPACGVWERTYLETEGGIRHFVVALSHWHLDHIAGLEAFAGSHIYALDRTDAYLRENREAIESGTLWGPPGISVVLPTDTFAETLDLQVGTISVQLKHYDIHSRDGVAMVIPSDRALYPGDMLEDTVTYIVEPGDVPKHLDELARMRTLDIDRIYPNHGDPVKIAEGGYTKALIDAVVEYDTNMLGHVHDSDYMNLSIENVIPTALDLGAVSIWNDYRTVHHNNLQLMLDYWRDRDLPSRPE